MNDTMTPVKTSRFTFLQQWNPTHLPVAHKIALSFVLLTSLILGVLWTSIYHTLSDLLESQTKTLGNAIATQSARSAAELLLAEDLLSLNVIATKLAEDDNIDFALFFNAKGEVLAASPNIPISKQKLISLQNNDVKNQTTYFVEPIIFQDLIVGYAQISLNKDAITRTFKQTLAGMTIATFAAFMLAIILSILVSRNITRPLKQLIAATDSIAGGNFDTRIPNERSDEIGQLIRHFNSMAVGLKEREQITSSFSQYVTPNIATNILANPEQPRVPSKHINASVLFIDIAGFTAMCEKMPPQEVEHLLNDYYTLIVKASRLYNGTVDKYMGDGAMILFGEAENDPSHGMHAICCALLLMRLVDQLNISHERSRYNSAVIKFKIGIHCGGMLAGTVGSNGYLQYTVVGNTVNIASRLCGAAEAEEIIISEDVNREVENTPENPSERKLVLAPPKMLSLKGKSRPLRTFVVTDVGSKFRVLIEKQALALLNSSVDITQEN